MTSVAKEIEVNVPVTMAYNQWTQFEEFPRFMEGVHEVQQIDERHLYWRARIGGKEEKWEAEIREQVPDTRIIWRSVDGATNAGMVTFEPVAADRTKVRLDMSYNPTGFVENVGDALGFVTRRVEGDLGRFKEFIEGRVRETGAYRATLPNPKAPNGHTEGRGNLEA